MSCNKVHSQQLERIVKPDLWCEVRTRLKILWFLHQQPFTMCSPGCYSCPWSFSAPGSVWASCCADQWRAGRWPGWWKGCHGQGSPSGPSPPTDGAGPSWWCWNRPWHWWGRKEGHCNDLCSTPLSERWPHLLYKTNTFVCLSLETLVIKHKVKSINIHGAFVFMCSDINVNTKS